MKRFFIIPLLLIAGAFSLQAQEKGDKEVVNEKFFNAKIREFVYQLELTDAQKEAFIPVYKRYCEDMKATFKRPEKAKPEAKPGTDKKGQRPQMTSEDAAKRLKHIIECQQKAQTIRLQYIDEFAKVLEPRQLMRLYDVEDQIQHKVMTRQGAHQGHPGNKGGRPNQGAQRPGQGRPGPGGHQDAE